MLSQMMPASSTGSEQSWSLPISLAGRQRCGQVRQQPKPAPPTPPVQAGQPLDLPPNQHSRS